MPSLNTRETSTPTPSNTLRRIPHATAEPRADLGPPRKRPGASVNNAHRLQPPSDRRDGRQRKTCSLRAARQPPVKKPEIIAFHISSFCRTPFTAQSKVENMPPQTPKLPPVTGARALITESAPTKRSPWSHCKCRQCCERQEGEVGVSGDGQGSEKRTHSW